MATHGNTWPENSFFLKITFFLKTAFLTFFIKLIFSNTLHGVSSASAGDDCILIWFWQDVPIDVNQFLVPEDYDILRAGTVILESGDTAVIPGYGNEMS